MRRTINYYYIVAGVAIIACGTSALIIGNISLTKSWDEVDWHLTFFTVSLVESALLIVFTIWYPAQNPGSNGWLARRCRDDLGLVVFIGCTLPLLGTTVHGAVPFIVLHHLLLAAAGWAVYERSAPVIWHVVRSTRQVQMQPPLEHLNERLVKLASVPTVDPKPAPAEHEDYQPPRIVRRPRRILDLDQMAKDAADFAKQQKEKRKLAREAKKKQKGKKK